jgi:hypothetical protein
MLMVILQLSAKWRLKLNIPRHEKFSFVSICMVLFVVFNSELVYLTISRGPAWATVLKSSSLNMAASSANSCESISRRSGGIWNFFLVRNVEALSSDFVCHFFYNRNAKATTLCGFHVGIAAAAGYMIFISPEHAV